MPPAAISDAAANEDEFVSAANSGGAIQRALDLLLSQQAAQDRRLDALVAGQEAAIDARVNQLAAQTPAAGPLRAGLAATVGAPRRLGAFLAQRLVGGEDADADAEPEEPEAAPAPDVAEPRLPRAPVRKVQLPPPPQPRAPSPGVDSAEDGEDDDDEAARLDDQLAAIDAPEERSLADAFGGHPLPCPHGDSDWPRSKRFVDTSCHYHPARVGDHMNGELASSLEALGAEQFKAGAPEWGTPYAYELRTLVPALSYLSDGRAMATEIARELADALRSGDSVSVADVAQGIADVATQLYSIEQHLIERVDVISAAARQSTVDLEVLARLYNEERRVAGGRSQLGKAIESLTLAGETRKLIAKSASERANQSQGAAKLAPRAPPSSFRSRLGAQPGRAAGAAPARDRSARGRGAPSRPQGAQQPAQQQPRQQQQPQAPPRSHSPPPAGEPRQQQQHAFPRPAAAPAPAGKGKGGGGRGNGGRGNA